MSLPGSAEAAASAPLPEIRHVFPSQWAAAQEIITLAGRAASVDILALRGSEIVGLAGPLRQAAAAPDGVRVRVLLLGPHSGAAAQRAAELDEAPGAFAGEIQQAQAQLESLAAGAPGLHLAVYHYAVVPVWRMIAVDDVQYVSTLCAGGEGGEAVVYKLADSPNGALYPGFRQFFENLLRGARQVI